MSSLDRRYNTLKRVEKWDYAAMDASIGVHMVGDKPWTHSIDDCIYPASKRIWDAHAAMCGIMHTEKGNGIRYECNDTLQKMARFQSWESARAAECENHANRPRCVRSWNIESWCKKNSVQRQIQSLFGWRYVNDRTLRTLASERVHCNGVWLGGMYVDYIARDKRVQKGGARL